ncbi:MAG: T9SS type A sorting domain-containing protein [Ignavibacteriae bacterium]|nr:T9SS type A sorting domain-containing protein [Ignavibacteriota bacterium]
MRDYFIKGFFVIIFSLYLLPINLYSWPTGVSQRTKKSNNLGCNGSCHTSGTVNTGFFSVPDTVLKGQSVQFTFTINKVNSGKGGVDIAAYNGLLDTLGGGMYLKIKDMELVHKAGIIFTSNTISINFLYVAPNYVGNDTLYATFNVGYTGSWRWAPNKIIYIKQPIGITSNTEPVQYELNQNYPNPFNPYTIISYSLKYNTFVNLDIYNVEGKLITTLVNEYQKTGQYNIPFSVASYPLSSGVYYYRLMTDKASEVKTMMMVK